MNEALTRLDEWAKFSAPLAYIVECLKQVMTEEIAGWIAQESKSAKGMWDYIVNQAKNQRNKDSDGVLVTPSQMQEYIYTYLRSDSPEQADCMATDEPLQDTTDSQISLSDVLSSADDDNDGQLSLL